MPTVDSPAIALLHDPAFSALKHHVVDYTGLAYYLDKDEQVAERLGRRMATLGLKTGAAYLSYLTDARQGEAELDLLVVELTIGETYFFRHAEQFDAIKTLALPELLARNADARRLRIWSAGCSTGAEAYSLSILLRRELGARIADWDITIIGTDINREFLARAQTAIYENWALRATTDKLRDACFIRRGNAWQLREDYRRNVSFQYHNLARHPFPSLSNNLAGFDLILCRNVTIYFDQPTAQRIFAKLEQCLVPDGWLAVGPSEWSVEHLAHLTPVNARDATLYRKGTNHAGGSETPTQMYFAPIQLDWAIPPDPSAPVFTTEIDLPAVPTPIEFVADTAEIAPGLDAIRALADQGYWREAADQCQALLRRDPLNAAAHFYLALFYEQLGQDQPTEHLLRRALYLDRKFALGHYHLGLYLSKRGRAEEARRCLHNTVRLLAVADDAATVPYSDGLRAGELREIAESQLGLL